MMSSRRWPFSLPRSTQVKALWICLVGLLLLINGACEPAKVTLQPPEIRYGEDSCDQCRMIISEARYAAAYLTADGQPRRFDDIGGMLAYQRDSTDDVASAWVHDYQTAAWIAAEEATYVVAGEYTPMGSGIVAFATAETARQWAQDHEGIVLDYAGLVDLDAPMSAHDQHDHQ
ncbi:MAG: nitrous oxide reductase accessory protein NosL [Candidatus Promineifilaceae bacterium]|nr:nitrous oxide reductase accessory protein NosL [Candidatus Promineifilaceae bacterium]